MLSKYVFKKHYDRKFNGALECVYHKSTDLDTQFPDIQVHILKK